MNKADDGLEHNRFIWNVGGWVEMIALKEMWDEFIDYGCVGGGNDDIHDNDNEFFDCFFVHILLDCSFEHANQFG